MRRSKLKKWVLESEDPVYLLVRLFRPLWPKYGPAVLRERGTFESFVGNPDNAVMFWEWVYDTHRETFDCVAVLTE